MLRSICVCAVTILLGYAAPADHSPFDVIQHAYAPYMRAEDPLAFPMKIKALSSDPYTFWRGSKDSFFQWCTTHCADWLADHDSYITSHGDLHLGNIGTYASGWSALSFGLVDFDDAAVLPFQIELLQGLISMQLIANQNNIALDAALSRKLAETLVDAYRSAILSAKPTTELAIAEDRGVVKKLLARADRPYAQELEAWTADGKFRPVILSNKGDLREILRPAPDFAVHAAGALAAAVQNSPEMRAALAYSTAEQFHDAILDVAQRTRLNSSGSQGLRKYVVLLRRPIRNVDADVIFYLKQTIPSAAERSAIAKPAAERMTTGERVKKFGDRLLNPRPYLSSWCDIAGDSYWVSLKEPWSDELSTANIQTQEHLVRAAYLWGTVAGAAHRNAGDNAKGILARLNPELIDAMCSRSQEFVGELVKNFEQFRNDPSTHKNMDLAANEIAERARAGLPSPVNRD